MKRIKKAIKMIKEMSKNPRKKALLQLGAWMIFFFVSYIIIILIPHPTPKSYTSSNSNEIDHLEAYSNMKNFEYTYTLAYQGKMEEMSGTYFDNHYYFNYLKEEYYSSLGTVYKVDSILKELILSNDFMVTLSIEKWNKESLKEMIKSSKLIEEKEYKNGKKIIHYEYVENGKIILLEVTESDKTIVEILIDYQDFYPLYNDLQVKLEYHEINNLVSYSKNYLDYRVVEGV